MSSIIGAPLNPSPQVKPIIACITAISEFKIDNMVDSFTSDFKRYALPKSLGALEPFSADGFVENVKFFFKILKEYKFTFNEIFEAPGLVVVHGSAVLTTHSGRSYNNEYMIVHEVEEQSDGTFKIKVLKEFVDSKVTTDYYHTEFPDGGGEGGN
ncbi:hypothetical protein C8Q75DRAFT_618667 [Abortiporus biennis]|nr:hypothetical protein C8Q75DRAFT_618667 [Abortiporus biennis]